MLIPDALEYYLGLNENFDAMGLGDDDDSEEEGDESGSEKDID